jgi:sugar/nucleoside kinase (ribokinase family)
LESGVSLEQAPSFQKAPGGAPANVAVGLAKLGHEVGFIGKVGDESFGHFLANVLQENGVDISGLAFDSETRTMLAFVSLTSEGERDFMFYRHPSADMRLTPDDIPKDLIQQATIFHYGSISLISEPGRSATCHALDLARESSLLISYDPNLRLGLWASQERAKQEILAGMRSANLVKINDDELEFLTGTRKLEDGAVREVSSIPTPQQVMCREMRSELLIPPVQVMALWLDCFPDFWPIRNQEKPMCSLGRRSLKHAAVWRTLLGHLRQPNEAPFPPFRLAGRLRIS